MSKESKEIYEFGSFRLDVAEHLFERTDGVKTRSLPEKAFQTLIVLLRNQGRLVTKTELLDAVWPDSFVEENNLDKAVHAIRHTLGESVGRHEYIETVRKHGYRFVSEVRRVDGADVSAATVPKSQGGVVGMQGAPNSGKSFRNAYEACQQARFKYGENTPTTTLEARELIEAALLMEPNFAIAHALSAELTTHEVIIGLKWPETGFAEARRSIARATEIGDESADFYASAAYVDLIVDWDFAAAEGKLKTAIALNPHHVAANRMLAEIHMFQGYHDKAAECANRAQADFSLHSKFTLAFSRFLARDFAGTIKIGDSLLELAHAHLIPTVIKCWAFEQMGRVSDAIAIYEKLLQMPNGEIVLRWAGYAYALAGQSEKALETANLLDAASVEHNLSPTHIAAIYGALGETDRAVEYLDKGLETRDPFMLWIATDPRFDNLRGHPRFDEIVKQVLDKGTPEPSNEEPIGVRAVSLKKQITASGQHALVDLHDLEAILNDLGESDARPPRPALDATSVTSDHRENQPEPDPPETVVWQKRSLLKWTSVAIMLAGIVVAGLIVIRPWQQAPQGSDSSRSLTQRRLTTAGGVTRVAVSRDGKYAAAAQNASLVLFDLQNNSERILVPASKDLRIMTIAFRPDSSTIYYGTRQASGTLVTVFSLPLDGGGEPTKILEDIYGGLSFSPAGDKFVFVRRYAELNEFVLLIANSDGSNITKLASSRNPNRFEGAAAWSPDGAKIACSSINVDGGFHFTIALIDVATGAVNYLTPQRWAGINSMVWLQGSKQIMLASQAEGSVNAQVWILETETGNLNRITNDQFVYESISGTPDGNSVVAVKVRQTSHVWMLGDETAQLTAGFDNHDGAQGLAWSTNERILYHSRASGRDAIWQMQTDGGNAREITSDTAGGFAVSPDGRFLAFQGRQSKDHLGLQIRDLDDGTERSLTQGLTASDPTFSPDGKKIIFCIYDEKLSLYEIPAAGGQSKLVSSEFRTATSPVISPSGRMVAFAINQAQGGNLVSGIAVIDLDRKELKFSYPAKISLGSLYEESTLQWSSDEAEIYYLQLDNSVTNIMRLRLADGVVTNLTNFNEARIFNFAVEPRGTRILVARGQVERDAALLNITSER